MVISYITLRKIANLQRKNRRVFGKTSPLRLSFGKAGCGHTHRLVVSGRFAQCGMVEKPRNITVVISVYEWISILVGGFDHLEKYESQLGLLIPIYGKIQMFQTTNQY